MSSGIHADVALAVIDSLSEGVIVIDARGIITSVNAAAERMFGRKTAELVGRNVSLLMPEPHRSQHDRYLKRHLQRGTPHGLGTPRELLGLRRDGQTFPLELTLAEVEVDGRTRFAGVARDVSERKEAETLLAMRGRVASAVNQILRGFITATLWTRKELFEEALENLLGLTGSQSGFIGELQETADGKPFLRTHAISDISWNAESRRVYREQSGPGLEFHNLNSLVGATLRTGEMVIANEPRSDLRSAGVPPGHPGFEAYLGLPIHAGGKLLGMVGVANRPGGYDEEIAFGLKPFLGAIGTVIAGFQDLQVRRRAEQDLYRAQQRLRILASQDGLTEVASRHSLMDAVEDAFARAGEIGIPLSVVFVDVDHLKRVNDAYGHRAGDCVLRHLARILRETTRPTDILGRYGGEQFVLAFLECEAPYARMVAERLRLRIEGEPFPADENGANTIPVTVSAGVASWDATIRSASELIDRAEQAAGEAKAAGRNAVRIHGGGT